MSRRKTISQREAVRNRRTLRQLRAFVTGISGMSQDGDSTCHIADLACSGGWLKSKMEGASWGANGKVVFVASAWAMTDTVRIKAVKVPT